MANLELYEIQPLLDIYPPTEFTRLANQIILSLNELHFYLQAIFKADNLLENFQT